MKSTSNLKYDWVAGNCTYLNWKNMDKEQYISVFKGSPVEADQVQEYLAQQGIGSLIRNHIQENLSAGWMISEANHAAEVFVSREDFITAEGLVKNMFHDGISADTFVEKEKGNPTNSNSI